MVAVGTKAKKFLNSKPIFLAKQKESALLKFPKDLFYKTRGSLATPSCKQFQIIYLALPWLATASI